MDIKQIVIALVVAALLVFCFRTCQRKKMEVKPMPAPTEENLTLETEEVVS